jgi:hypothetical protein
MGEKRNACRTSVGKPEKKKPPGRPKRKWVDKVKMDLKEIGWDCMDWIDVAGKVPVEDSCEHGIEPSGSMKCCEVLEWVHN